MRPIDADALLGDLRYTHECLLGVYAGLQDMDKRICSAQIASFIEAIMRVKEAPTIAAVPVVCCEDCAHYTRSPFGHEKIGWCRIDGKHRSRSFFCANVERKGGKNDETEESICSAAEPGKEG